MRDNKCVFNATNNALLYYSVNALLWQLNVFLSSSDKTTSIIV